MDLEMLDGFLTAIVSGPEMIQPSEWLPVVWSDSQRSVSPVVPDNDQAQRILSLVLRLQKGIARTLAESPTRFKPLLYHGEADAQGPDRRRPKRSAWCEGYMTGVMLRESRVGADLRRRTRARLDAADRGARLRRSRPRVSRLGRQRGKAQRA